MVEPREAVQRLKRGNRLSPEEITELRLQLASENSSDIHNLCRAFALASPPTPENVLLIERFLKTASDDWDLQGVIYALCHYWGLTSYYVHELVEFIQLDNWARRPSAAIAAFSALGAYLHRSKDPSVFRALLNVFDAAIALHQNEESNADFNHMACCYTALDRGIRGNEALLDQHGLVSIQDFRPEIVTAARQLSDTSPRPLNH